MLHGHDHVAVDGGTALVDLAAEVALLLQDALVILVFFVSIVLYLYMTIFAISEDNSFFFIDPVDVVVAGDAREVL